MKDEFRNRLGMFNTSLGTLHAPQHKTTWENQPPVVFTTKVGTARTAYDGLVAFTTEHSQDITGSAADKRREEDELEVAAFNLGQALLEWFTDQDDLESAAKVDRSQSAWRRLADADLVAQAKIARDLAQGVVGGPDAATAADYGITQAEVDALTSETDDFETLISAPQQSIAGRKALTGQYRARFNEVEAKFESLDRLILRFNKTEAGRALIAAYQASRVVRDLGSGGGGGASGLEAPPPPAIV